MHIFQPDSPEPPPPPIYGVAASSLPEELWRAADIALLAFAPPSAILFLPTALPWRGSWSEWTSSQFTSFVAPHLLTAQHEALLGVRELAEVDRAFTAHLSQEQHRLSVRTGRVLLDRYEGARHLRQNTRLAHLIDSGQTPGHAASVLALHGTLFHIPPPATLLAYLIMEWTAAHHALKVSLPSRSREAFLAMSPGLPGLLRQWLEPRAFNAFQPGPVE